MSDLPKYPATLLEQQWDKNKGTVAKMKGETGLGTQLKALEQHYKQMTHTLDLSKVAKCRTMKDCEALNRTARKVADDYDHELEDFKKLADQTAKRYKSSKVVGKKTREYVEKMAAEDTRFRDQISEWEDFTFFRAITMRMRAPDVSGASLTEIVNRLPVEFTKTAMKMKQEDDEQKKVALFGHFFKENPRTLSGDLKNYVQDVCPEDKTLGSHIKIWTVLGSTNNCPKSADAIRPYAQRMLQAHEALVKELKKRGFKVRH